MFGLTNATTFSGTTTHLTAVAGTTSLYRGGPGLPEGVLFKRISDMQDALDCGGLMVLDVDGMNNVHTGTKWVFYVGKTFRDALANDLVGSIASPSASPSFIPTPELPNVIDYTYTTNGGFYQSGAGMLPGLAGDHAFTYTSKGAQVVWSVGYWYAFRPQTTLQLWGVVSGATRGCGSRGASTFDNGENRIVTDNYSFMATDTPMEVTFTKFLMDCKAKVLLDIESNVREYYAAVYDATAANRLTKPTVSAVTAWKEGQLCRIPHSSDALLYREEAEFTNRYNINTQFGVTKTSSPKDRGTHYPTVASGPADRHGGGNNYPHTTLFRSAMLGRYHDSAPHLPLLVEPSVYLPSTIETTPAVTGKIGAYRPGKLRDGHLMCTALVDDISQEDVPGVYNTISEMVTGSYFQLRKYGTSNRVLHTADSPGATEASALAEANAAMSFDSAIQAASSVRDAFAAGSIVEQTEQFIVALDVAARNYAESQN